MNIFIRLLYALLIAAAVVAFIGVGIYTFYPGPEQPAYPSAPIIEKGTTQPMSDPSLQQQNDYQRALDAYNAAQKGYQRNVSIILATFATGIIGFGLWLRTRSDIIAEGLQLGGIGTSIYAITAAAMADSRIMRFVAVSLFLAGALVVVYFKFQAAPSKQPARKRAS